jgi:hypothetical protein
MPSFHRLPPVVALAALVAVTACDEDNAAPSALSLAPAAAMASSETAAAPAAQGAGEAAASTEEAAGAGSVSRTPMAALAGASFGDGCDSFPTQPASITGSHVYQEVKLKTRTAWPGIDNITMNGGRAISARGSIESSTVGPVNIVNAGYAFYTDKSSVIRNVAISNFKATQARREGIRLRGNLDGVTIRNFFIQMQDQPQTGTDLPEGIAIFNGQNIVIEDGCSSGFKMVPVLGTYTNGDGISAERPVNNLTIRRVTANDNSDAGFDLKSNNTFLYDTHAERNFRNYRFWTKATTGTIYSADPGQAHVWIGANAVVVIDKLVAKSTSDDVYVLWADNTAKSITVRSCELDVPNARKFFRGSTTTQLILGPGCSI